LGLTPEGKRHAKEEESYGKEGRGEEGRGQTSVQQVVRRPLGLRFFPTFSLNNIALTQFKESAWQRII
jgi:hypothetical protein